jgi:uncharacterized protein
MDYPCTGCGECCKRIQAILDTSHYHPVIEELVRRFPYKARVDGSCEMLTEDMKCSVYKSRPLLCNIKLGAKLLKMDEKDWYRANRDGCNLMIEEAGLGEEYLVVLDF